MIQYVTLNQMFPMSVSQGSSSISSPGVSNPRFRALFQRVLQQLPVPPILWRIGRFLTVGVVGLAVDSGLFWGLYKAGFSLELARALSLALATLVTWGLNRLFTFAPSGRTALAELIRYVAVALVAQGFNYGLFLALVRLDAGAHPLICLVGSAAATAALSFTGQNLVAFRRIKGR